MLATVFSTRSKISKHCALVHLDGDLLSIESESSNCYPHKKKYIAVKSRLRRGQFVSPSSINFGAKFHELVPDTY